MTGENEINTETLSNDEELETEAPETEAEQEAEPEPESIADSIRAAQEEIAAKNESAETDNEVSGNQAQEGKEPTPEEVSKAAQTLGKAKKGRKTEVIPDLGKGEPARLLPPERLSLELKEKFHQLPQEFKEVVSKSVNELEGYTTKVLQDAQRERAEINSIREVTKHYAPEWHQRGLTEAQAIAEYAATDRALLNPETRLPTVAKLLKNLGITPEMVYQFQQGGGAPQQNLQQNFQKPLTEAEVVRIWQQEQEKAQQQYATQARQQAEQSAAQEVLLVKNEVGANGRYLYPELHDDNYIQRVKPFVAAIRESQPHLSFGEATKQGIFRLRVAEGRAGTPSSSQPKLSQQEQERINRASVSVRSRGNPSMPTTAIPENESVRDSIMAARAGLIRH